MILSCQNISKAFSENKVLENISFHIENYEKAAIVGINGAGKTTLLRIIVGETAADSGTVTLSKGKSLGYLAQDGAVDTSSTIYDELLSVKQQLVLLEQRIRDCELSMQSAEGGALEALMKQYDSLTHAFESGGGYLYRSEVIGVLKGLGFEEQEFGKSVSTLSGGQKTRVALGKLLLQKPDLIILDEPTNHLDMSSITWLETYLINYKGAVIIVSHDRYFLNRIVTKVIEIDQTKAASFSGNYSDYAQKKEQLRIAAMNAYLNQQREIRHHEEVIEKLRSFNREKSIRRAESREKMLEKIEVLEKPTEVRTDMHLKLIPRRQSGNDVLTVEDLGKAYGSLCLFQHVDFEIKRGEHVAIIGDNGTGKTTLLKILNRIVPPDSGCFRLGMNVEIGYYDQEHHVLHEGKTLFEEISDEHPAMSNTEIRNLLAAFLFTGDDVFKYIKDLSGGERGRLSLAKLMLGNANFLILDEPTNHLDIASKEILEDAINSYEGTVLYVSHDRYFINRTAHKILDLTQGRFVNYIGNYDYYLEKHDTQMAALAASGARADEGGPRPHHLSAAEKSAAGELSAGKAAPPRTVSENASSGKNAETAQISGSSQRPRESDSRLDWKAKKEEQARLRKRENDLKKCEDRIAALEQRGTDIDALLSDPSIGTQVARLQELSKEQAQINTELEALYAEWETLAE